MNTIYTLTQYAFHELKDTYRENEIRSICRILFTDVFGYTNIGIHLKKYENLEESFVNKFFQIIRILKTGKPLQYVLGETEFAGLKFAVDASTLIPRPETEELTAWIEESVPAPASILDIGSGSGCITVALSLFYSQARVCGIDISEKAVRKATENALRNHSKARFLVRNILQYADYSWDTYDLIVSNPPYVRNSEKAFMESRVTDFEPHTALFVPDEDPLLFYRAIAGFAQSSLQPGGYLFFEINESLGQETVKLLEEYGYSDILLKKDINDKDRFIQCRK